jgi:TolB-like protein/tetratricopeptide (TPR) repeat protein
VDVAGGERLTETGLALGTPSYMSPEQAAASRQLDGRSDLYALGCVAYEMLAGAPPFTGSTAQAIMARHAVDPVPPLRTVRATVPAPVAAAIERALAKVPADRFATAREFADALLTEIPVRTLRPRAIVFRRTQIVLGIAATVAALGIVIILHRRSGASAFPAVIPSASAIAVFPFRSSGDDTALTRLGRELATTVSASLDGVGGVETADRLIIASETSARPRGSPADEAALARRLGARSVLRGTLVRAGDNVRLDLGFYDAGTLAQLGKGITVMGNGDSIGALTDSIVLTLLQQVWQRGEAPSPSLAAVTTRSLPALRAFLDGERSMGQGDWGAAVLAYRGAIAADSTFVMADFRYLQAKAWFHGQVEPEVLEALRRGAHTLPERERLITRAYLTDTLALQVERLREVTRQFPDHWPGWFLLGDLLIHDAPLNGYDWTEGLQAFRRVVALNPRLVPAWEHIFAYANGRRQPDADRAAARLRELGSPESQDVPSRLLNGLARSGGVIGADLSGLADSLVKQFVSSPDEYGLQFGSFALGFIWQGFPTAQIELNRRALPWRPGESTGHRVGSAWAWAARGRWDSATAQMAEVAAANPGTFVPRPFAQFGDPIVAVESYGLAVLATWLGATAPAAADQRRPAALAAIATLPDVTSRADAMARTAWFDGLLGLARGDRNAIAAARRSVARSGSTQAGLVEQSLAAFDRALGGDRRGAGRDLATLEMRCAVREECSHFTPVMAVERLAAAQWLRDTGDLEAAVGLLRWQDARINDLRQTLYTVSYVLAGPTSLARARLEEARGERRRAAEYYRRFLQLYDQPMPAQAHLVEEAREALVRLGGEP